MGFKLEHNFLLRLSDSQLSNIKIKSGSTFTIIKDGMRLYPIKIPLEFCNQNYQYLGKIVIDKIIIKKSKTEITARIIKVFSKQESKVFSENFMSPKDSSLKNY